LKAFKELSFIDTMQMSKNQELNETYQKKTQKEHIKDAPDTYVGAIEPDEILNWSFNNEGNIAHHTYTWTPALYKLFDESIVNCRDHYIRLNQKMLNKEENVIPVTSVDVSVDKKTGIITLMNDGNGIDIAQHPQHKLWIPEMIFGHLMTSTNYKKSEKKIVGGKNGFGVKLVFIYSKWARLETVDHIRKKKYIQIFKDNLDILEKPKITKASKSKPYVKIEFLPDYERFGMSGITDDMFNLFKKRTYDIAAVTDKSVRVRFNNNIVPIRTFEQYLNLYIGDKSTTKRIFEKSNNRWEYGVCLSPLDEFTHVSFVNGVYTLKGGKHVEYILNQIVKKIINYIEKKKKIKVKPATIKEQLMIFVNCVIENPSFDSQTKDYMNTPVLKFGSKCDVSDKFIDKVIKLGVMDAAISLTEIKDNKAAKKTDGRKSKTIRNIPKLIDANWAGGTRSPECTLILCEGDSAKAGIVSGLSKADRNQYGVFPLKGKLMNTKDMLQSRINDNAEIANIKKIIGLETGKIYENATMAKKSLRYGHVLFMTDQDLDGSHIKGLCVNLFHSQWRELLKLGKFLGFMNTPIIKAKKGIQEKSFYSEAKYKEWKQANNNGKGWKIKYFKGLGTSTAKEFKEYFAEKKMVYFTHDGAICDNAIDMAFNKKRADDRKDWLGSYDPNDVLNPDNEEITYKDFVGKELIHFSKYDCDRSIPNMMDGKKISTRKILFAAFKRKLHSEIKVAQFAGYTSEHSLYHHGEKSLVEAIVNMAQEYVGSNNINELLPLGQFGTRLQGGKDHASERYIYTMLNPITKYIYREADLPVLNYLDDDGTPVQPDFYAPIIPMVLVNGGKGIGTGFSYEGLSYNPSQIIDYLSWKLKKGGAGVHPKIEPYYEGFKGTIVKIQDIKDALNPSDIYKKYLIKGCYKILGVDKIQILELPIGTWTDDYKKFLESLMEDTSKQNKKKKTKKKPILKSYIDMSTDTEIDITIRLVPGVMQNLLPKTIDYNCNQLEKVLGLYTTKTTTNMNLFDNTQQLKKYVNIYEIVDKYFDVRYNLYVERKKHQLDILQKEMIKLSNKARFIQEQCVEPPTLVLRKKKKNEVIQMLKSKNYDVIDGDSEYKYLRTMSIDSVEEENLKKLLQERENKKIQMEALNNKSIENIWLDELEELSKKYAIYRNNRIRRANGTNDKKKLKKIKRKKN
jgi:DNA topoisomerase-2